MNKKRFDIDPRFRSLLRKAVRRGNETLVVTICALVAERYPRIRNRLEQIAAAVTFEECWPWCAGLAFNRRYHSRVAPLVQIARTVKTKDAAGLGTLAYTLSRGDFSVLDGGASDRDIKIVARGLDRPEDYWRWLEAKTPDPKRSAWVMQARQFRDLAGPRERAIVQAAGYLASTSEIHGCETTATDTLPFPYWIALDRHTPQGGRALKDVARDLHIDSRQLELAAFYFEGAVSNAERPSLWWNRLRDWHFTSAGMPPQEAHLMWEPARVQLRAALLEDGHGLHKEIYSWKLCHLEEVAALQRQVALFITHFDEMHQDQMGIFQ